MSKRDRPTTAAEAAHRRKRHEYRSARNSPEGKAARAAAASAPKPPAPPATKPSRQGGAVLGAAAPLQPSGAASATRMPSGPRT
jgi:hypothetical protein